MSHLPDGVNTCGDSGTDNNQRVFLAFVISAMQVHAVEAETSGSAMVAWHAFDTATECG
jgi:hypothetical protein